MLFLQLSKTGEIVHFNNTAKEVFGSSISGTNPDFVSLFNLNERETLIVYKRLLQTVQKCRLKQSTQMAMATNNIFRLRLAVFLMYTITVIKLRLF